MYLVLLFLISCVGVLYQLNLYLMLKKIKADFPDLYLELGEPRLWLNAFRFKEQLVLSRFYTWAITSSNVPKDLKYLQTRIRLCLVLFLVSVVITCLCGILGINL